MPIRERHLIRFRCVTEGEGNKIGWSHSQTRFFVQFACSTLGKRLPRFGAATWQTPNLKIPTQLQQDTAVIAPHDQS